jgi:hypothetical protein
VKIKDNPVDDAQRECDRQIEELLKCVPLPVNCSEEIIARICRKYDVNGEDVNLLREVLGLFAGNFKKVLSVELYGSLFVINGSLQMRSSSTLKANENIMNILLKECDSLTGLIVNAPITITNLPSSIRQMSLKLEGAALDARLLGNGLPNLEILKLENATISTTINVLPPKLRALSISGENVTLDNSVFGELNGLSILELTGVKVTEPITSLPEDIEVIIIKSKNITVDGCAIKDHYSLQVLVLDEVEIVDPITCLGGHICELIMSPKSRITIKGEVCQRLPYLITFHLTNVKVEGVIDAPWKMLESFSADNTELDIKCDMTQLQKSLTELTLKNNSKINFINTHSSQSDGGDIDLNTAMDFGKFEKLTCLSIRDSTVGNTIAALPPSLTTLDIKSNVEFKKDAFRNISEIESLSIESASIEGNAAVDEMPIPKRSLLLGPGFKITAHLRNKLQACPKNSIDCTVE